MAGDASGDKDWRRQGKNDERGPGPSRSLSFSTLPHNIVVSFYWSRREGGTVKSTAISYLREGAEAEVDGWMDGWKEEEEGGGGARTRRGGDLFEEKQEING